MRNIIKKILIEGDFDWVYDEPINPWYDYDGIIFDIPIPYNVVNDYIDMAFKARPDISNKAVWQRQSTRHDINTIIGYANNGKAYLAVDKETSNLSHANAKRFWDKGENWIKYSDLVNEPLTESSDFDWASGFEWSKEMLDSMLTDCKSLRVANFNVPQKQPYQSAGGPSVMFLTRCKDWWDYLTQLPLDDNGRGPSEWFTPEYWDEGRYGVVWNHYWRRNKENPTLEDLKDDYTSAITTEWGYGVERQFNGTSSSEAWFAVDENNKPIYDLIPPNVQKYAKIYEEYFFGDKLNESEDDWGWTKEIPGTEEYGRTYRYFEIIACYGIDYETEECDDEYSHFIRIPKGEVEEIWRWSIGYMGGPGDEGDAVISYAIDNNLIPPRELEEIVMFQGVLEVAEDDHHLLHRLNQQPFRDY